MPPLFWLNTKPAGVTSFVIVTVQFVAVPTPKIATRLFVQMVLVNPVHQFVGAAPQLPLPSCAPARLVLASHTSPLVLMTLKMTLFVRPRSGYKPPQPESCTATG